ncbi:MAG: branched-chain amino acid ABC transporter permease [Oxalobacteraceae bacterium]|jgi:ABC-type branched-subunit amino acid transport system permease subunit|nr:branched-chain amino acid ABC transporter permease [Oxalobacteraceae bacterium]
MTQRDSGPLRTLWVGLLCIAILLLAGTAMPRWLTFLLTMSFANGIVALGIMLLMRSGVVSFGQGLVFATGGYTAALGFGMLGINDGLLLTLGGGLVAALFAAPFAWLISRYRGIFFAMLTLALSMVLYGLLIKTTAFGGSDGLNIGRVSYLGVRPADAWVGYANYAVTIILVGIVSILIRMYFDSMQGFVALAARDNEIRVEYLGSSVRSLIATNFIIAAFCGGIGGALAVIALGHVEPDYSYWTRSGDFVFVAILAGHHSVLAAFIASIALELVRSFSSTYFPHSWQLAMGLFLLVVIRFLPTGIGSLWAARARSTSTQRGAV